MTLFNTNPVTFNMNSNNITNMAPPVNSGDATTKLYVDGKDTIL